MDQMMMTDESVPILSICIPTYNRGTLLNKLLDQLSHLSDTTKSRIQICISDNCSSDNTSSVIEDWKDKLNLFAVRQEINTGASKNFQIALGLSVSPWAVLIGDDDLLSVSGFEKLIESLENIEPNTWVLADTKNPDGTTLLQDFPAGSCTISEFKKRTLLDSLESLGFIGTHVVPQDSIRKFMEFDIENLCGWPHLGLLFHELSSIKLHIHREYIIKRLGDHGKVTQTFHSNDWLCLKMRKTKICCLMSGKSMYTTGLALREYLSWCYIRQTLYSMLCSEKRVKLFSQASSYIDSTEIYLLAKYVIKIYVLIALLVPVKLISFARKLRNPDAIDIETSERIDSITDGVKRGL